MGRSGRLLPDTFVTVRLGMAREEAVKAKG